MAPPSSSASRPLAAAVGLAVLGAAKAKDLPGRAVMASLTGVGAALSLPGAVRREYDQLAAQGERVLARLSGRVDPDLEPEPGADAAAAPADEWIARPVFPAPPSGPAPVFPSTPTDPTPVFPAPPTAPVPATGPHDESIVDASGTATDLVSPMSDAAPAVPSEPAPAMSPVIEQTPDPVPHQEAVAHLVQEASVAAHAEDLPPGGELTAGQLPLEDFDHLTLGSLRGRLRRLSAAELVQLREYELAHGHRLPIMTMLDNRIAKLEAERAAATG